MSSPSKYISSPAAMASRSRANTGASLTAAAAAAANPNALATSFQSTAAESEKSNGSLLDLYARSPASFQLSNDDGRALNQPVQSSARNHPPASPVKASYGFQTTPSAAYIDPDASFLPLSESNASIWTTASAANESPLLNSKRASVGGIDAEALRSIQYASDSGSTVPVTQDSTQQQTVPAVMNLSYDSDGSHYDDEDMQDSQIADTTAEAPSSQPAGLPTNTASLHPLSSPFDHAKDLSASSSVEVSQGHPYQASSHDARALDHGQPPLGETEEVFSNALPSPPVPRRTSSVLQEGFPMSPSHSQQSDLDSSRHDASSRRAASRRSTGTLTRSQIPRRQSSSDFREDFPNRHSRNTSNVSQRDSPLRGSGLHDADSRRNSMDMAYAVNPAGSQNDKASPSKVSRSRKTSNEGDAPPSPAKLQLRGGGSGAINSAPASPTKRTALDSVNEISTTKNANVAREGSAGQDLSLEEQQRLERELLAEADESRPRTLKEARERARLRRQQSEAASASAGGGESDPATPADETVPSRRGPSRHTRGAASILSEDQDPRSSIDSKERPRRNPKRVSKRDDPHSSDRQSLSEQSAPSDYSHDSEAEGGVGYESAVGSQQLQHVYAEQKAQGLQPPATLERSTSGNMDELTETVNHAMNDLTFSSADDTLSADETFSTPMPPSSLVEPTAASEHPLPVPLSARNLAAATRDVSESDTIRQETAAIPSSAARTPQAAQTPKGVDTGAAYFASRPNQPQRQSVIAIPPVPAQPLKRQSQPPPAVPTPLPPRIGVYGKTLPLPKAFVSSAIIDRRRAPSWERARSYAQCTNELLRLQTGVSLWMETVQRPAMRQQQNNRASVVAGLNDDWRASLKLGHVRNEVSDADSIRSDMTFPMRGDGGKAKELVSVMPTMPESPNKTPANLPYPGVMTQRSESQQSFTSISSGTGAGTGAAANLSARAQAFAAPIGSAQGGSSTIAHRSVGSTSGGFFSSLGRKNSKRTPSNNNSGAGNVQSSFSSIANAVGASRGYRTPRNKTISSPLQGTVPTAAGSMGNVAAPGRPSTDTVESVYSTTGGAGPSAQGTSPESPASGPLRMSGLGLNTLSSEPSLAVTASMSTPNIVPTSASTSTMRLATVSESPLPRSPTVISPVVTSSTMSMRPMGPRAPGSQPAPVITTPANASARPSYEMARNGSTQSFAAPQSATLASPGASGGTTFLSRMGGGSFSSGGHSGNGGPKSGHEEGAFSSPDLHPSHAYAYQSPRTELSPSSPSLPFHSGAGVANDGRLSPAKPGSGGMPSSVRSSFSYGTVRDRMRRASSPGGEDEAFQEALTKLGDILPDADTQTLAHYLRKAKGNDLAAIGDYLQDQSQGKLPKNLR